MDVRGQAVLGESWAVRFGQSAMLDDDVFKGYGHSNGTDLIFFFDL